MFGRFTVLLALVTACAGHPHPSSPKVITSVTIGARVWMDANLDVDHYGNGEMIAEASDWKAFKTCGQEGKGCWIIYAKRSDNSNDNDGSPQPYGTFYNYDAVHDRRGLCPSGFHVPTYEEWHALIDALGPDASSKAMSTTGWAELKGTNTSGFNALPGGEMENDRFHWHGHRAYWWASTEIDGDHAMLFVLRFDNSRNTIILEQENQDRRVAASVRCIKN